MAHFLVTGGAGFIGSHFVELAIKEGHQVVVLDLLTYAGHRINLESVKDRITFIEGDICNTNLISEVLHQKNVDAIFHFAAESHVDRSITGPAEFMRTNIMGTYSLLEASLSYWKSLDEKKQKQFTFLHVSTDEVYGELGPTGLFSETSPYQPNSPYSASKASSDLLVRAWHHTYHLPTLTTNCSNNYGPRQYPEKLIPFMIHSALNNKPLGIYGNGQNIRDWIHVQDHCQGILLAYHKGQRGQTYCFGGNSERNNVTVVEQICKALDEIKPRTDHTSYSNQIKFVQDRPGHDLRYAIDDTKATQELGYKRHFKSFESGLKMTVQWYIENRNWRTLILGE